MKSISDTVFLSLLLTLILSFGILIFILPTESFSQKENRPLAEFPELSFESIGNGKYFEELGRFYKDSFPLRNGFTALYSISELCQGKREVGGVMPLSGDTLVRLPQYDISSLKGELKKIYSYPSALLYVPPSAADSFKGLLPHIYNSQDFAHTCLDMNTKEMLAELADKGLSYRTDHHWTTEGAYIAYGQICQKLGITPYEESFFKKEAVCTDFYGTSFSRSGLPYFAVRPDSIVLYRYEGDSDINIYNHEAKSDSKGFYDFSKLEVTDKYGVFLGGNYSHLSITHQDGTKRQRLLLIKDSFANSLVPFLSLHFDIEMVDPRYCTSEFLEAQLSRDDIDATLFVLSMETMGG